MAAPTTDPFTDVAPHRVRFSPHAGQRRALESRKRFVVVLAGSQSGKTITGPVWLAAQKAARGPGDYLCIAPSYPLMQRKMLPEFLRVFRPVGWYHRTDRIFHFRGEDSRVLFGHADDPEAAESATAKAAWLDEAGQKRFRYETWEAITRRLAIHTGRVLITTTPYTLGWLKQQLFDPWKAAGGAHPDIDVINFDSTANPAFPRAEYERARATLPGWRFRMFYKGLFEKPAGLIYDAFSDTNLSPRFAIPAGWPRYLGLDFGGVNTAGIFFAEDPGSKKLYGYREYHAGGRTAKEHAQALLAGEPGVPVCVGGSKSEGQWRAEFRAAGLPVREPAVSDVEVGIDRAYSGFKTGRVIIFEDLAGLRDELGSYSRPVDAQGQPMPGIEDKEKYHRADALRYVLSWALRPGGGNPTIVLPPPGRHTLRDPAGRGRS